MGMSSYGFAILKISMCIFRLSNCENPEHVSYTRTRILFFKRRENWSFPFFLDAERMSKNLSFPGRFCGLRFVEFIYLPTYFKV